MVNEIEKNVCKKKERFFVFAFKRGHILDNYERALGKYRFDYSYRSSILCFFFFFINAYVKIQRMTSPFMQRIYRFHTLMRAFFDSFPAYAFSFLPCCVFSHCSFRCNNEYIIWRKGIRLKYISNKIDTRVPFVGRPRKCQLEKRGNPFFEKGGQTKIVLTKRQCTLVRLADKSCNVPLSITRRDAFSLYTGSRRGRL